MSDSDTKFTLPFIAHLQQIVGIERAQLEKADTAVADTAAAVAEAERILQEALDGQRVALGEQRVAAERYEAVLATVQAAESYASELGLTDTPPTDAAEPGADATHPQGPASSGTLAHLIVDVLEPGKDITVPEIYEKVWALRPEVANNAVRAALSQLHKAGRVENVRRGVYRLLKLPEDHTTAR
ncbi:hypothetical protein F9278_20105 [Streptomyces phaeolivaceus]|uniref:Uncharacterized protein n=1 Tax=Streptomyces phaeolivaceus TaxID=2653200 RepID=A0A5P8K4F0_9ACTN|nr:hypothetical protein [Streptomyces phaeolivaceus]QFQ98135.1 hypothetical protein F9278_20105 [Streptomyces phaeolivaceus]